MPPVSLDERPPHHADTAGGRAGLGSTVRTTLLHRPETAGGIIERPDRLARLDRGLDRCVTIVTAPAGFGKSVLVSQWCDSIDRPVAWLSMAQATDGLLEFAIHVVAAVRTAVPDALGDLVGLLDAGRPLDADALTTELSNGLDDLDDPIVIVLDDYHVIESSHVHRVLGELLAHPSPAAHFVILARRDPTLPLDALRARGNLNELRIGDLTFTEAETRAFVDGELDRPFEDAEVHTLQTSTEGWPAGVRLAVEAIRRAGDPGALVGAGFMDLGAQDFLLSEVLENVPPPILRYLIVASYFDQFSAQLCEATTATAATGPSPITGDDFIEWITRNNLFVVPLDAEGRWFRFHHLFARRLRSWREARVGLGADEAQLRRSAARVLRDDGFVGEAIRELRLAGDEQEAVDLAFEFGTALLDEEHWGEVGVLLDSFPDDVIARFPALLVLRCWHVGDNGGRHREMRQLLDLAESQLTDDDHADADLRGQIAVLRGTYDKLNSGDFDGALADSEYARRMMSTSPGRHLAFAYALGAVALSNSGRYEDAQRLVAGVVGDQRFAGMALDPMIWMQPFLAWLQGDVVALERGGAQMIAVGERFEHRATSAFGHYFSGTAAYERNDLALAEQHLSIAFDTRFTTLELRLHGGAALALTELAGGQATDAIATAEATLHEMLDARADHYLPTAQGLLAHVEHRAGRTPSATRWAQSADTNARRHRYMFFDRTPTLIELLLTSEADEPRGRMLLAETLDSLDGRFNRPLHLKLSGLDALRLARAGDEARSLEVLRSAVDQAHQGGMVRSLADLGPELIPLLQRVEATGAALDHVGAIVDAVASPAAGDNTAPTTADAVASVPGGPALTARELDVLRLLAARYTNREIASELYIAVGTVKKRTVSLYDKLNVHGRREAVMKARALGYLRD